VLCQQLEEHGRNRQTDEVEGLMVDTERTYERTVESLRVVVGAREH
jgi:hypothetical protein